MSERYSRLFSLSENLYAEGAPVLIAAGALLKDNETGKVLAQLKLRSISDKKINQEEKPRSSDKSAIKRSALNIEFTIFGYIIKSLKKYSRKISYHYRRNGIEKAERYFNVENYSDPENMSLQHYINQAIKAQGNMKIRSGAILVVIHLYIISCQTILNLEQEIGQTH